MRIALIRLSATPLVVANCTESFGGAEVRAVTFARGLARTTDHDVRIVVNAPADQPASVARADKCAQLQIETLKAERFQSFPPRSLQKLGGSLRRRLRMRPRQDRRFRMSDVDCFVAFGVQMPSAAIVRTAKGLGKPVVVSLTSDEDARRVFERVTTERGKLGRMLRDYRYALLAADAVLVQTTVQQQLVENAGQRAVLIRNPIDIECGSPAALDGARPYVLWVGRADTDCKRADLAFEVAARCPEVSFVMVMNPTDPATTDRLSAAKPDNVRVIPSVDWEASDALYANASALLNTSESEGFPNAFLQAGKFGIPILSRRVNPDGILTRFGVGFVAHDDLDELAAMTQRIVRDPGQFRNLGAANRQYVVQYHEADARFRELDECLQDLVAASARRRSAA